MGKPKIFSINLFGNNPVYFAGLNIEGNILLELSEAKKAQGISVVLSGEVYVHWTETRTTGSGDEERTETIHYSDSQIIFNSVFIQLWGNGTDSQEIPPGRYEFPFKFQLPSNLMLPTSFESNTGYIRYSLTATIKRSWKFNHTAKRAITINEIVDINTPQLSVSLSSSREKMLCCLCCASGPISLSAKTDRGGYCPGESIAITTEAENHSRRRITAVRATLKQIVTYHAQGNSYHDHKVIQRIEGPGIEPGGTSNWSNELLPIPPTAPCISSCRIIQLSYVLIITLGIPWATDLHVEIPVIIGNVPYKGRQAVPNNHPPAQNYHSLSEPHSRDLYPPPPLPSDPYPPGPVAAGPPSETVFNYSTSHTPVNIASDNYTMGETEYAPVYGFVTNYQYAPPQSYPVAVCKIKS